MRRQKSATFAKKHLYINTLTVKTTTVFGAFFIILVNIEILHVAYVT